MLDVKMLALTAGRRSAFQARKNYRDNVKNRIVLLRKRLQEKMRRERRKNAYGNSGKDRKNKLNTSESKCSRCEKPKDQWEVPTYLISGSATDQPKAERVCRDCLDEIALLGPTKYPREGAVEG